MSLKLSTRFTDTTVNRSPTRAWLVTVMLVLLMLVNWGDKAILGLVAVPLMHDLHIGPGEYGLLSSAVYFLFSASAVFAGFLANRHTTKWLLFGMVSFWSLTQFSIWLAPTFAAILVSRAILGFAEGPSAGLAFHAATKWFRDKERNVPIALQNVGSFGGIAVAAPALTYVIVQFGWHWAFFVVGAAGVVWLVLWLLIGKEGPLSGQSEHASNEHHSNQESVFDQSTTIEYRHILLSRSFVGFVSLGLAAYWALAIVSAWLPAYLRQNEGYSATAAANIVLAVSLSAIGFLVVEALITHYLMGRGVSTRISRGLMAGASTTIAGVFIILATLTHGGLVQNVYLCVGFGLGLVTFTTGAVSLSSFVPVLQRGAVLGIYVAIITSPGIYAPAIFGGIVSLASSTDAGYWVAMLVSGIFVLIGGAVGLVLINPERESVRMRSIIKEAG